MIGGRDVGRSKGVGINIELGRKRKLFVRDLVILMAFDMGNGKG